MITLMRNSNIYSVSRLVGIMLQILIIILFRISSKKLSKCFYYSQVPLIMLKIIPSFYNFFNFIIEIYSSSYFKTV